MSASAGRLQAVPTRSHSAGQSAVKNRSVAGHNHLLRLQRAAGNKAVLQFVELRRVVVQRAPYDDGSPEEERVTGLIADYQRMSALLDAISKRQITVLTETVREHLDGLKDNPGYKAVWRENLDESIPAWRTGAVKAGKGQVLRGRLSERVRQGEADVRAVQLVVSAVPSATAQTWISAADNEALGLARGAMAPALAAREERVAAVRTHLDHLEALTALPPTAVHTAALTATRTFDATPAAAPDGDLADATRIANAVSGEGIKAAIHALLRAANADPARGLITDGQQVTTMKNTYFNQPKARAEEAIAEMVENQHVPGVAKWRKYLGIEGARSNLYIGTSSGPVDGYNTHTSLFMDTIGEAAEADVTAISAADMKTLVLGSGTTGFHVTLEQGGPGSALNPRAYRGQPAAVRNNFEVRSGKSDWPLVKTALEGKRDTQVTRAEGVIDAVKAKCGAPPEKVQG